MLPKKGAFFMEKVLVDGLMKLPNGEGNFGICYILNDDYLIKSSKFEGRYTLMYYPEREVKHLTEISNDSFIFPVDYYAYDGEVIQTKLKYIKDAKDLDLINYNIGISDLISATYKVYDDIKAISDEGIITHDVWAGNILYKDKRFYLIDREGDIYLEGCPRNEVLSLNLFNFNFALYIYILGGREASGLIKDVLSDNLYMADLVECLFSRSSDAFLLKELLLEFKKTLNNYIEEDEDNLGRMMIKARMK